MDPATHILAGALIARATAPTRPRTGELPTRTRVVVGMVAAGLPDADFFMRYIDVLAYLAYHRSVLNSVLLWPVWTLALAFLLSALSRGRYSWRAFFGVCFLSIGLHIVSDLITSFGSMIFAPLSFTRVSWDTTFIIDPYFTAIIVAGLLISLFLRRTRVPSVTALTVLAAYVGFQTILHERALWLADQYAQTKNLEESRVYALPQPLSPFNWMLVVAHRDTYYLAYINLIRKNVPIEPPSEAGLLRKIAASYRPIGLAAWQKIPRFGDPASKPEFVKTVFAQPPLRIYRHFALLPALYRIDEHGGNTCVWFQDLRFFLPGREPIFVFGLCRDGEATPWRVRRLS